MTEYCELLLRSTEEMGLSLSEEQLAQFMEYQRLLLLWNQRMNLTAITDPYEIVTKHFLDSISPLCYREIRPEDTWIDVGTGAGFPGIPLKIMRPEGRAILLDSLQKRIRFLDEVISGISLANISCIHARAEEAGRVALYHEQMDICFARAVAKLPVLCEYCLPFVKPGGLMLAYKGPRNEAEILAAQGAVKTLGGEIDKVEAVELPGSSLSHSLIFIRKIRQTAAANPGKPGKKRKSPMN